MWILGRSLLVAVASVRLLRNFTVNSLIAHLPINPTYVRRHGAGGDGDLECFAEISNIDWSGWQAKHVWKEPMVGWTRWPRID